METYVVRSERKVACTTIDVISGYVDDLCVYKAERINGKWSFSFTQISNVDYEYVKQVNFVVNQVNNTAYEQINNTHN